MTQLPVVRGLASSARWVMGPFDICSLSKHFLGARRVPGPVLSTEKWDKRDRHGLCSLETDIDKSDTNTNVLSAVKEINNRLEGTAFRGKTSLSR